MWYRNDLRDGVKQFILIDTAKGTRTPGVRSSQAGRSAFQNRPAAMCWKTTCRSTTSNLTMRPQSSTFTANNARWSCNLASYEVTCASAMRLRLHARRRRRRRCPAAEDGADVAPVAAKAADAAAHLLANRSPRKQCADGTNLAYDPQYAQNGRQGNLYEDAPSPDGKWTAVIKENNIFLRGAMAKKPSSAKRARPKTASA